MEDLQHIFCKAANCLQRANDGSLENLIGEAFLTIAVGKALVTEKWNVETEKDLRSISKDENIGAGYFNYDLLATKSDRKNEPLLFEFKYLKSSKRNQGSAAAVAAERIEYDIIKLALPQDLGIRRFLVIASNRDVELPERLSWLNGEKHEFTMGRPDDEQAEGVLRYSKRYESSFKRLGKSYLSIKFRVLRQQVKCIGPDIKLSAYKVERS